jgi:hypothetical protein
LTSTVTSDLFEPKYSSSTEFSGCFTSEELVDEFVEAELPFIDVELLLVDVEFPVEDFVVEVLVVTTVTLVVV